MADIFISYANEDRETAAKLARVLESAGWTVWWDRRIPAGRTWRAVLAEALKEMRCMITLWSRHSTESPWVAEEAEEARRLGKPLVPILIERVEPPIGFRAIQAADLVNWGGTMDDPAMRLLVSDLRSLLGAPSADLSKANGAGEAPGDRTRRGVSERLKAYWPHAALAGAVIVALWAGWQKWQSQDPLLTGAPVDGGSVKESPPARMTSLILSGERKELRPSETLQLKAIAQYSDGKKADISEGIEWSSDNAQVALVSEKGEVKAVRAGSATITAQSGGIKSSPWRVDVKAVEAAAAPQLIGVQVIARRIELFPKEKVSLRVQGRFSDHAEKYLSSGIEWEISDQTVASVSPAGQLEALRPGRANIVARLGELKSAPLTFIVKESQAKTPPPARPIPTTELQPAVPSTKVARTVEPRPAALSESARAAIVAHVSRAKAFREQGNYAGALAELEKAKTIDVQNEEVRREIEQTQRACNAEKLLGQKPNC
jgi:hypothetical protein